MLNQKHQRADSSAESVEMTDDRNVLKQKVTGDESCMSDVNVVLKGAGLYRVKISISVIILVWSLMASALGCNCHTVHVHTDH
jgi:hypothetical protein